MPRMRRWVGSRAGVLWTLALAASAAVVCAVAPPRVVFQPQPLAGLVLVVVGVVVALWPARPAIGGRLRWIGVTVLWLVIAWCVLSQPVPLTEPQSLVWSLRLLPVLLAVGVWLWPQLPRAWQRRTLAAVALPSVAGLALVAWGSPPHPLDFAPYYVVVDAHGTLYVSDAASPVIRVFGADGALRAKLRPGLASLQGPPGPGFSPPGPYNDPDGLGVPRATPGSAIVAGALQPWPLGTDDFWFCGLTVDGRNRLYVPDWMRGRMLRFGPDGQLEARLPLPTGYQPSLGCVTATGNAVYLSDAHGAILRLDPAGEMRTRWSLPEAIIGGIAAAPDGRSLYALARTRVYRLDLATGGLTSWPLPAPTGPLGQPYQAILPLHGDRVLITNLAAHRIDIYTADGRARGSLGGPGRWPGQFGQVGGLARDGSGHVYVADFDHRALQRFIASGRLDALYRSPDDDEAE